jgi:hypothetical protein
MLTPSDIDALDTFARSLARRSFGGKGSVERQGNGIVRLTLVKHDSGRGNLYRQRDMTAATFEDASKEIALEMDSATDP